MKTIAILLLFTSSIAASDPEGVAFFEQKIRPVLIEHCYPCHSGGAPKLKGNLLLDSKEGWAKGGDSGEPAIIPGMPDLSLLLRSVQHLDAGIEMPPGKPKLPDAIIADLAAWIAMGAPDPRDGKLEVRRADKSWWSLQPLSNHFENDRIDQFVQSKLKEFNLTLSPRADPRSLLRRISYDLTGLPPSAAEVASFITAYQSNPQHALESLVDRLLASPRYGERWGRHWLDVTRFGESNGFERNFIIDDLWPFRDYVIKSFNDDKPFDQFMIEHLAGDVIGKGNPDVEVGSAFLVAGPYDDVGNQSLVAQKNIRAATLDEMVTATAGAFLGLTINCARCHNHKFDPIPTEDYYRVRAAFEGVTHGRRVIASSEERNAFTAASGPLQRELGVLTAQRDAAEDAINIRAKELLAGKQYSRPKIDVHGTTESFPAAMAKYIKFVVLASTNDNQQAKGKRSKIASSGRLTEFQVWTNGPGSTNVALATNGAKAQGAKSTTADDFPEAYGPQFCIDGQFGEQWFIGEPAELTIALAEPSKIDSITFVNARGGRDIDESKVRGATPCEYQIQISLDGRAWQTVASDEGREPWSLGHAIAKARRDIVLTDEETNELQSLEQRISQIQRQLIAVPKLRQIWAGNYSQPKDATFVDLGGDPMKPGKAILPASLTVLDGVMKPYELAVDAPESDRRLALAKWIANKDNPLTLRVLANRLWQYHFGDGIVDTPSDFGFLGSRPSHPELLDYLANRLLTHGWRLKPLHREIVLSEAYLQSSTWREEAGLVDKDARFLWRFSPRRLSAEEIRDTMLCVAGKLKLEPMGGPGFRLYKVAQNNVSTYFPLDTHGPETFRRAVYHQNARASVVDVLSDFDLPDIAFAAPKRANTTSPSQVLTMLNHNFTLEMSKEFAARLNSSPVAAAYEIAFQRPPTENEREAAEKLVSKFGTEALCRALLNSNELVYIE
jgi:mono/diheme cytochrome c family protein